MADQTCLGLDFGTTNTVVSVAAPDGRHEILSLAAPGGERVQAFRSALSFQPDPQAPRGGRMDAGPFAIEAFVQDPVETRFIQSFKTFAASAAFTETQILQRRYSFEDLLGGFLLRLREHGPPILREPVRLIVGRPVVFAGSRPDADLALARYEEAFRRLGYAEVRYAYEPVGAAFFFARRLEGEATVLVGDFGGGTSDFSIIRFTRRHGSLSARPLGHAGVGVAGDAFDYRIIDNIVSPELGKGSDYLHLGKQLPIPNRYFTAFARWDQLALLRTSRDMREIRGLVRQAVCPERLGQLVEMLDDNHAYAMYQAVHDLKIALSTGHSADFRLQAGSIDISRHVRRTEFEAWIAPELEALGGAIDRALEAAGLPPERIDRIFLTGGSSLTPAVRDLFFQRFSAERIESGSELESIAAGLSLMGHEPDLAAWTRRPAPAGGD